MAHTAPDELPDRSLSNSPASVIDGGLIVIVDPISTGACLAKDLDNRGYRIVRVWSDGCPDQVKAHTMKGMEVTWVGTVQVGTEVGEAASAIRKLGGPIKDVLVGCETGVRCCDLLAAALGCRGNGVALSELRRNKYEQIEAVRAAGLDAPLQVLAASTADVEAFLAGQPHGASPFKAVVKPVEGAGSDGVSICDSPDAVRAAFGRLEGTRNVLGLVNYEVLLQEYLRGDEYVVDTCSMDGVHKVVAIWKYDKRSFYGAPVVYFGMRLLQLDAEPALSGMVAYVEGVLDAMGIRWGAMHTEVKLEERGPVLVEVNCRLHGGEGIWLPISQLCLGYTQVSAMADAYLRPTAFDVIPAAPTALRAHGAWVTVRARASGTIRAMITERLEMLRELASYLDEYLPLGVGDTIAMTVDACTIHGCFNLAHSDAAQLEADYALAQGLVEEGLFDIDATGAAVTTA